MIYLDASALLKLVRAEAETSALRRWLAERDGTPHVSSVLARIEVTRASRRYVEAMLVEAHTLLTSLDLVPLSLDVVEVACQVGDPLLRSLDAIHLASALTIRTELSAFVAYDHRLYAAAAAAGLPALAPGQHRE